MGEVLGLHRWCQSKRDDSRGCALVEGLRERPIADPDGCVSDKEESAELTSPQSANRQKFSQL